MPTTQKHHKRLICHFKCPEIITTQSRSVLHALSSLQRRICAHQSILSKLADVLFIPEYPRPFRPFKEACISGILCELFTPCAFSSNPYRPSSVRARELYPPPLSSPLLPLRARWSSSARSVDPLGQTAAELWITKKCAV